MTNQNKKENTGLKQTSIGDQGSVITSGFGGMRSNTFYYGNPPNNKTLNNQINARFAGRTFLISTPKGVGITAPQLKDNKLFVSKQKDLLPNQLSYTNLMSIGDGLSRPQQKKYDLLMLEFDNHYPIGTANRTQSQAFSTLAPYPKKGAGPNPLVMADSRNQRVLLKKPSFLAYWLLPFLGLISGTCPKGFDQNKGLVQPNLMLSNQETNFVSVDINPELTGASSSAKKLDQLDLNTDSSAKVMPNSEQENGSGEAANKLVRFYLKELETNYTFSKNQKDDSGNNVQSNFVKTVIPKEGTFFKTRTEWGWRSPPGANLNFILNMPSSKGLNKSGQINIMPYSGTAEPAHNQINGDKVASPHYPLGVGNSSVEVALKKATFKIRPNNSYGYEFSNNLTSENQKILTPKLVKATKTLSCSAAKIIKNALTSNYLPLWAGEPTPSLETATVYDKGNQLAGVLKDSTSRPVILESLQAALPKGAERHKEIASLAKSQEYKNQDAVDLGLTFTNYLKYLKSRIALVSLEGQKYVGNRGFSKSSTKFTGEPKPHGVGSPESGSHAYRVQIKALVGQSLGTSFKKRAALSNPSNKFVAKGRTFLNSSAKPELSFARTQNAISIVLNHKKFNKAPLRGEDSTLFLKKERLYGSSMLANQSVEEEQLYITKKKDLQKKHKAKKQRLESRRQKKRKRFYPRPTWLRLRLGLSMSDRRSDLAFSTNTTYLRYKGQEVGDLKQGSAILNTPYTSLGGLGSELSALSNTKSSASHSKNNISKLSIPRRTKWQKTLKATNYNQIVYNLIVSKNLLNTRFVAAEQKPHEVKASLPAFLAAQKGDNYQTRSEPNVSFYKSENQVLSDFVYRKRPPTELYPISCLEKESRAQIQKLIQIKNNANYVNFEPAKAGSNPSTSKETKSSLFKDFWIWLYNSTNRNSYNKTVLADTVLNCAGGAVPINLSKPSTSVFSFGRPSNGEKVLFTNSESNKKSLKLAAWAFNQTNLLSSTNKRLNVWATLKLRNQSKNNKTKYIEKKLKKQLNSTLSPFVIKNLAKLEVPNQLNTAHKNDINYGKLASRINIKMNQKEQKLAFITNMSGTLTKSQQSKPQSALTNKLVSDPFSNIMAVSKSRYVFNNVTVMPSLHDKDILAPKRLFATKTQLSASSGRINQIEAKYMQGSAFSWWRNISSSNAKLKQVLPEADQDLQGNGSSFALTTLGLLFHFCALISLVSISQIRCFIKFHLILLHKLSNGYLQVLFKTSSIVQKYLRTSIMSLSTLISPSQISFPEGTKNSLYKNDKSVGSNGREETNSFVGALRSTLRRKSLSGALPQKKVKKSNQYPWQVSPENSSKVFTEALSATSDISLVSKNQVIISTFSNKGHRAKKVQSNVMSNRNGASQSVTFQQDVGNKTFRQVLFDKPFKLSLLNLSGLASTDKAISNPLTGVYGNSTVATLNISSQKEYRELVRKNLQILQINKQLAAWRYTKETVNSLKKDTLNAGYKVVDTFESFLRIIYGIFEKPYEFTMDWIAYAFLVEWSSDVLSYTPQNNSAGGAQAKNWSTFVKLVNQNQLNLLYYTNQLVASTSMVTKTPSQTLALQGLSTVALSQFLTKRILYLNDLFLTILYRPDTDLIIRQRKGTLFWDIWSDFLLKAADKYNINVPSLSNIKEEQNVLLENFLSDPTLISAPGVGDKDHPPLKRQGQGLRYTMLLGSDSSLSKSSRGYGLNSLNVVQSNTTSLNNNKSLGGRSPLDYFDLVQQSITYQSKETDLFLEYHPPKSFSHISAIKYYSLVQQPIGSLVCQIYAGILEKQIAKNVLVIGSTLSSNSASSGSAAGFESMQKTLLIQALAGETEMKMITDNASRYAVVSRGFAVGIKYLKEVFEAITLNTPCLFLLEDIHLIGERRPQLISDHGDAFGSGDGMSKATEANFGSQHSGGAAVHEKNQISYQLSRHSLADYKKPFKGDFSLAIPSNHFSFDFFLKSSSNTGGPFANFSAIVTHPLANTSTTQSIFDIDNSGKQDGKSSLAIMNKKLTSKRTPGGLLGQDALGSSQRALSTSLQLSSAKNSLLSPPSTSPFSVLLLKEQKKLKAKKIVKELPWIGLPSGAGGAQQVALLPRVSYSVRAKVSALAELGFSSMSAKLDMITDLLVIIDSVRGHRGFVVFATTHLPHILDPALRRPGRLDETISIPTLSNLWTRWEFSKTSLNPISSNSKQRLLDSCGYISNKPLVLSYKGTLDTTDFINLDILASQPRHGDPALRVGGRMVKSTYSGDKFKVGAAGGGVPNGSSPVVSYGSHNSPQGEIGADKDRVFVANKQKYITKLRHVAYYQMGKKLFSGKAAFVKQNATNINPSSPQEGSNSPERSFTAVPPFNLSSFSPVYLNPTTYESVNTLTETSEFMLNYGPEALKYKSLYMSPKKDANGNKNSESFGINNVLVSLMGGKFTEFFASTSVPSTLLKDSNTSKLVSPTSTVQSKNRNKKGVFDINKPFISNPELTKNLIKANFISLYGIDQTWRAATSFTLSLVQKRYLFNKNLVVPKLLNLLNFGPLEEAPSPPSSNILVPAKRFENAKKGFKETIQYKLFGISTSLIQDKLESHKKQSYIRNIFNKNAATASPANQNTGLSAFAAGSTNQAQKSYAEGPLLQITSGDVYKNQLLLPTSASLQYQNKILNRHKIALNNQWWNGLLTEHTAETLFLSDIDWRYTFIQDYNSPELYQKQQQFFAKLRSNASSEGTVSQQTLTGTLTPESLNTVFGNAPVRNNTKQNTYSRGAVSHQSQDVVIDFPDADQYYNPKQRRWFVTSGYWNSWFNVNQDLQTEVFDYLIFESIITSFSILNNNRELLDYAVSKFIKTGLIKETNYKIILKKFS